MATPIELEPFVQDTLVKAWDLFKKDVVLYLLAGLITIFLGAVTLGVLFGPLTVGFIQVIRRRQNNEAATAGDVFAGMQSFLPAFLATLLIGIGVVIGSMLLFIPGLIVAFLAMFTYHFIAFKSAPVGSALGGSFTLIKDQFVLTLVLFLVVAVLNAVGGAIMFGSLVAYPFGLLVLTVAFEKLTSAGE